MAGGQKLFYMPWYVREWMSDAQVGRLHPSSRAFWFDCLNLMWIDDQCGMLEGTVEQLAQMCRCNASVTQLAIEELQALNVATVTRRNEIVTIMSRRMRREYVKRKSNRDRQKRHRQPELFAECHGDVTQKSQSSPSPPPHTPPPLPLLKSKSDLNTLQHGTYVTHPNGNPNKSPKTWQDCPIPSEVDCQSIRAAVDDWLRYKRSRGESYKSAEGIRRLLVEWINFHGVETTKEEFQKGVNNSIAMNYAGCKPGWSKPKGSAGGTAKPKRNYEI